MEITDAQMIMKASLVTDAIVQPENISVSEGQKVYTILEVAKKKEPEVKTVTDNGNEVANIEADKSEKEIEGNDEEILCVKKHKLEENSVSTGVAEPECSCKKIKFPENIESLIVNIVQSRRPLKTVMSDEFTKPMPFTKVYVGQVMNVRDLSKIILLLNERLPLKDLSHLKRAYRKEVILFPVSHITTQTHASVQNYIEEHVREIRNAFEYFKILDVPAIAPKIRKQYLECGRSWSLNFHPDKYLEKLYSAEIFSDEEIEQHRLFMSIAFEVAVFYMKKEKDVLEPYDILSSDVNATIVVDPVDQSVVAVAFDNRVNHPVQHSAMIAIDNVAKTQNGGAWNTSDIETIDLRGIGYMELLLYLKHKYPNVPFGAREYISKSDLNKRNLSESESPYLCTGYYIYMIREPCVMCAMGLVHARSKRVFFSTKNTSQGALMSIAKLHCVPSLNHHFEVFTDFF